MIVEHWNKLLGDIYYVQPPLPVSKIDLILGWTDMDIENIT